MTGIVSYGGYIPRKRLNRMSIYQGMGWYVPALISVAQGERSFANWDEDSLTMAVAAARNCVAGEVGRDDISAVFVASTTLPFADRNHASVVATALNLSEHLSTTDFSASLRASTSALQSGFQAVASGEHKNVLLTASDMRLSRSASFYEMWYGDGAASLLLGSENVIAEYKGRFSLSTDFLAHYRGSEQKFPYTWEERWVRDEGYSRLIPQAIQGVLDKTGLSSDDIDHVVYPCFFGAEHKKIARKLGFAPEKVADNLHSVCGETGTAHPLLMLLGVLEKAQPGEKIVLCSFGQGCDAFVLEVTEHILQLPQRRGLSFHLEQKTEEDNYLKFLQFRGLLESETGIRAEAQKQTAMSALYRNRRTVLGMVGGQCRSCGTVQFPSADICVNPECKAVGPMDEVEFSDRDARIMSFTGDMLAVSQEPPAMYGMIEFTEGGRVMLDFTDCKLDDVAVGQAVELSFRRKYYDEQRDFVGYFWKAIPDTSAVQEDDAGDELGFHGRVAIVTGAGNGLGRTYALELARRGAVVVVNDPGLARDGSGDTNNRPAEAVVQEILEAGGKAVANFDSVATAEGGQSIVNAAIESFGRVDVVINNAGILRDKSFSKMTPELWRSVLSVHLDGAYHVTRAAWPHMREQKYGRVLMTTSAAGLYGNFGQANYGAAKLALVGMANSLQLEGAKHGIKVNTVAPVAASRMTEDIFPPDLLEKATPAAVCSMAMLLVSEECPAEGQIFNVGMGYANRAAIVSGEAVQVGSKDKPPTVEDIAAAWSEVNALRDGSEHKGSMSFLTSFVDLS
jgi:3-hydroxy-3-methylglutaryl CoA synthase/NAD(P)-dependent dehydrogenase (short-subunit alcohol dehydrogenase family)